MHFWFLHLKKDIVELEKMQRRMTGLIQGVEDTSACMTDDWIVKILKNHACQQ